MKPFLGLFRNKTKHTKQITPDRTIVRRIIESIASLSSMEGHGFFSEGLLVFFGRITGLALKCLLLRCRLGLEGLGEG